jgi:hypothetical protein
MTADARELDATVHKDNPYVWVIRPLSDAARQWLARRGHLDDFMLWDGETLIDTTIRIDLIVAGMMRAGLRTDYDPGRCAGGDVIPFPRWGRRPHLLPKK